MTLKNPIDKTCRSKAKPGRRGFTLIEVSVSMLILGVLMGGLMTAYSRTADRISVEMVRSRASGIAQKKMEYLLASMQEPNVIDMTGEDQDDPRFNWQVELKRIPIGGSVIKQDLSNTVIEIKVTVQHEGEESAEAPTVELARYVSGMKPRPGQAVAVPASQQEEEPLWLLELREQLGREPTPDEIMQRMLKSSGLPEGMFNNPDQSDVEPESEPTPNPQKP
jgi:prepilin-type N-terminal cleavage/methylation domain-containing protein